MNGTQNTKKTRKNLRRVTLEFDMEFNPGASGVIDRHMEMNWFLNNLVGCCVSDITNNVAARHKCRERVKEDIAEVMFDEEKLYTSLIETGKERYELMKLVRETAKIHIDSSDLQQPKKYEKGSYYIVDMAHLLKSHDEYEKWLHRTRDGHYMYKGYPLFSVYIGDGRYDLNGTKRVVDVDGGYVTMIPEAFADKLGISKDFKQLPFFFSEDFEVFFTDNTVNFGKLSINKQLQ